MEVAEQEREWQKEEEVVVEETALQERRSRNLAAVAAAIDVSDATSSGDEMLLSLNQVNESAEGEEEGEESEQEEIHYGNRDSNNKLELHSEQKLEMLPSLAPVHEFQQQEEEESPQEELQIGNEVESDSQQKLDKNGYCDQEQGTESISGYSVTDNSSVRGSASEKFFGDGGLVATRTKVDSQRDDNFSGFVLQPSEKSSEEHKTNESLTDITESRDEIQLIKEIDNELTGLDVETVLAKQDTHDLYCPNCNSCITRMVILRKRKRKIRIYGDDPKRNKLETVASESDSISAHATIAADISVNGSVEPAADDHDHTREPEFFRCLSCFSIFVPSGKGFTLFKIFGDKGEKENVQSLQPISTVKKNWLSSIFASHKEELLIEQGNGGTAFVEENIVAASEQEVASPTLSSGAQGLVQISTAKHENGRVSVVPSSTQGPKLLGEAIAGDIIKKGAEGAAFANLGFDMVHQVDSSSSSNVVLQKDRSDHLATQLTGRNPVQTEEPAENVLFKPQQGADVGDPKLLKPVPVLGGSDTTQKVNILADFPSEKGQNIGANLPINSIVETRNVEVKISETAHPSKASHHSINGTKVDIHIEDNLKSDKGAFGLSVQDDLLLQDTQVNIIKDPAKSSASTDTIITIKEGTVQTTGSQEAPDIITSPETVPLIRPESVEARGSHGVEIIKSMVYGGLMESITSLGIVSSAAGADASTLNILALALANMVGGLFIIGHNLWDLKADSVETSEQVTTQKDRYQELLGRRENFLLHATVAILSFLIFGLIPPVVYGFSFRVSDSVDYKLIAVAGASLLCIIILAIGKVYVQRPPTNAYIKTIIYYVVMGFLASGVSYAVGDLIKKLMDKLGWFDSTLALTFPNPGTTTPLEQAWGSY